MCAGVPAPALFAGQIHDVLQILLTFRETAAPAVVSDEYEGVICANQALAVLPEPLFMVLPHLLS